MWDLPRPGLEPVSPALAGGFSTTAPPGKPSFLHLSCVFTFLEIIKHNMPKMLLFSSIFNIKMATQKVTKFDKSVFLNACYYDSCHIQSNKVVSNEVKDN